MKIFNVIIGILSVFGALYCIFWPDVAFLNAGWIVALVTFLWGVCAVLTNIIDRKYYNKNDGDETFGTLGLTVGIVACALSVLSGINDTVEKIFLVLVLILLMTFLVLTGVKNIIDAFKIKRSKDSRGWWLGFIFGSTQVLLALFGVFHWLITAGGDDFANILIGLILGVFGLTLIATIFSRDRLDLWGRL